jgi:hypothetical protein
MWAGQEEIYDGCGRYPRTPSALKPTGGKMSIISSAHYGILGIALVPCLSLSAAGPVHYGFSVHANIPMSDLDKDLNGKVGGGASFQVSIETSERTILRPRLDLDTFPVSERDRPNDSSVRERVDLGSVGIGADYLYSFSGRNDHGCYVLGGVGVQRWIQTFSHRDDSDNDFWHNDDTVRNRTSLYVALGTGYQFTSVVGLEARVVGSKYDASVNGSSGSRNAIVSQLALTCRW